MVLLGAALRREALLFLLAVQFLTRLPLPQHLDYSPTRLGAARRYFPLVGIVVGSLGALVYGAAVILRLPQVMAALLATAATILVTGAFHEDGLADTFDGLGAFTREKMLAIMQDSRIGVFGAAGLGVTLALKVAALASLPVALAVACLVAGHGLSRLSNVVVAATSPYVRNSGAGSLLAGRLGRGGTSLAAATGLGCLAVVMMLSVPDALAGLAGLALGHLAMRGLYEKRLGGHTGDTQGAVQQWSELGFYLGVLTWHSR
ncbi:MAG: adenosylcobinamide-GDP ribazoletransferase [Caldilineaceae bacterium]|nr:adenosylcobinamide-GDP ribazoletransferase [Caldilineaceae bacterium]